ncbi:unnamed protein product [Linum trigynum]|uniref:Uncharacterized protein n=1 Tax=Linum trigynum TaxID=586398 RepID=A0AAV2G800_9ROSI
MLALVHDPSLFMTVVAILWRIWRSRIWVVFEGKQFGIPALMRQQYEEWVGLPVDQQPRMSFQVIQPGTRVDDSRLVCMWDGATRRGSHSAGGMVLCG